jgi:hypothetical protein
MGASATRGWPQQAGTDLVNNAPAAINNLADAIAADLGSPAAGPVVWTNVPLSAGTGTCRVRKSGDVVHLEVNATGQTIAANNFTTLTANGAVPAAFRPAGTVYLAGNLGGSVTGIVQISAAGQISVHNSSGSVLNVARCGSAYLAG